MLLPAWCDQTLGDFLRAVLLGADEKLGSDSVVLNVAPYMDAFECLVLVSGRNDRHVRTLAEEIERYVMERLDVKPMRVEGWDSGQWIALDYGFSIVHVFDVETRDFYDLEHLWSAADTFRPPQRVTIA
ncbi:MAG: ribosome silencing factor [Actinomycetota bacterium]|jgi:ribosome-associated protein